MNTAAIAKELNILENSLVFVDDNPAEREIIKKQLPSVAVPEMLSRVAYGLKTREMFFSMQSF